MSIRRHTHCYLFKRGLLAASPFFLLGAAPAQTPSPQVFNHTKSLVVESVDVDDDGFNVSLRSTSPEAVFGLALALIGENGVCDLHTFRPLSGSLIEPEGHLQVAASRSFTDSEAGGWGPRLGVCSAAVLSESNSDTLGSSITPRIVIDAVDFEDGTYEGDQAESAMFEAERLARDLQRKRIVALVEEELNSAATEDSNWVSALRARISSLTVQADPEMLQSLQLRFGPTGTTEESIRQDIQSGLMVEKGLFLNQLKLYLAVSSKMGVPIVSLRVWWDATKGQCDFFSSLYRKRTSEEFR